MIVILSILMTAHMWATEKIAIDKFTYIQVDNQRTRHESRKQRGGGGYWFGLDMGDLTGDGYKDIVSGKWFYRNPGGDMTGKWERIEFQAGTDGMLIIDVDDDAFGDFIAAKCNKQYWFEAKDKDASSFKAIEIGDLPLCDHGVSPQGCALGQLKPGGKEEIIFTDAKGIFYFMIPDNPQKGNWPNVQIADESNGEGIVAADVNGDGFLDVCGGFKNDGVGSGVAWWENPGDGSAYWKKHIVGCTTFGADRFIAKDLNGDGLIDIATTEEWWRSRKVPWTSVFWFEQIRANGSTYWMLHKIITQYSINSLDAADMDRDGDIDLITCEHKGPNEKVQIFENDGKGGFTEHIFDRGKEGHLGMRVADMDNDGDLDITSIAWDDFPYLHLWRNDAIKNKN